MKLLKIFFLTAIFEHSVVGSGNGIRSNIMKKTENNVFMQQTDVESSRDLVQINNQSYKKLMRPDASKMVQTIKPDKIKKPPSIEKRNLQMAQKLEREKREMERIEREKNIKDLKAKIYSDIFKETENYIKTEFQDIISIKDDLATLKHFDSNFLKEIEEIHKIMEYIHRIYPSRQPKDPRSYVPYEPIYLYALTKKDIKKEINKNFDVGFKKIHNLYNSYFANSEKKPQRIDQIKEKFNEYTENIQCKNEMYKIEKLKEIYENVNVKFWADITTRSCYFSLKNHRDDMKVAFKDIFSDVRKVIHYIDKEIDANDDILDFKQYNFCKKHYSDIEINIKSKTNHSKHPYVDHAKENLKPFGVNNEEEEIKWIRKYGKIKLNLFTGLKLDCMLRYNKLYSLNPNNSLFSFDGNYMRLAIESIDDFISENTEIVNQLINKDSNDTTTEKK